MLITLLKQIFKSYFFIKFEVALWDCNANKQTHIFSEHNAPATAVAFSPVNEVSHRNLNIPKSMIY